MSLDRYTGMMNEEALHDWATDAQNKIDELMVIVNEMRDSLYETYKSSPEGRLYLNRIDSVLNL